MDFTFTEEQTMLQDATRRFIGKEASFEQRRQAQKTPVGYSKPVWQGFADLGLLALLVPEDDGGLGGTAMDSMLVMEAIGEGLVIEPYLASAVLATRTLCLLGNAEQRARFLPGLIGGTAIAAFAHDEATSRFERLNIATSATPTAGGYILNGHKSVVQHGASADVLLITARMPDQRLAVFALPKSTAGLRILPYTTVDGIGAAELHLAQLDVPAGSLLDAQSDAEAALNQILDLGIAAVCAEAVGALDKLLAATIAYAKNRKQFGVVIGKFQALQHKMADMVLHIEQARSMSYLAAVSLEERDPSARAVALSSAKVVIGQACRFVGQQAVQLHGGMGVTDELDVSHYFKRLMAIELQFGSTDHHLEMVAQRLGS
ncbi:acyl-CoA dehydrogenase family protein [Undibacterium sp. Jales W-56]|uniref:acyl-CoA dehydrogenase family protein n=1 Tax=Undibacterium sp. Jales W-56 TaxID=2897325 RepID=UPI0021D105F1|nr:acyl-CoA dehydrogenase family protein [Undibacterium sp. Jales W-56]MCU6432328.1 acyl-CoA dehydrogenase family protein [Undibacterium sp. Jales W-56]